MVYADIRANRGVFKMTNLARTICKTFVAGSTALLAVLFMATGMAQAEVSAWTGCVTPGGTIIHLTRGDTPAEPCQGKQALVHLRDEAAFQNADANYKQGAISSTATSTFAGFSSPRRATA